MARRDLGLTLGLAVLALTGHGALAGKPTADPYQQLIAKRQYERAAALVAQSARSGNPLSQYRFAVLLRSGLGVKRDEAQARAWLKQSSSAGNLEAAKLLKRLSVVVTTDQMIVKPEAPKRSARIANLSLITPKPLDKPSWAMLVAARAFDGIEPPPSAQQAVLGDPSGETPLIAAARGGNLKIASRLMSAGANVNTGDKRGGTPLYWAAQNQKPEIFNSLLAAGAAPQTANTAGETPILAAAKSCKLDVIDAISAKYPNRPDVKANTSVAHQIVRNCPNPESFKKYFNAASIKMTDGHGRTLLWYAVNQGNTALVEYLLEQKAVVATSDSEGITPLHLAAAHGRADLVALLLKNGAEPEALDKRENSPLMMAATRGSSDCVVLLVPVTTDIDHKNADGETALMLAAKSGKANAIHQMARAGASFKSRNISRDTPERIVERMRIPYEIGSTR